MSFGPIKAGDELRVAPCRWAPFAEDWLHETNHRTGSAVIDW